MTGWQLRPIGPEHLPWTDRSGRVAPLRLAVFLAVLAPAAVMTWSLAAGNLGPKPVTALLHQSGDWAVRLLLVSLAITPLRRIGGWNRLIGVRRMLGLAAAGYAVLHLGLYTVDQGGDLARVAREIAARFYLAIGTVAVAGLLLLAATSTDAAVRRLGPWWHRLHALVYGLAALAIWHFFLQSKADVTEPTLMAGAFLALMACRAAVRLGRDLASPLVLLAIAGLAGLGTAAVEYLWYALATNIPAERVLAANLDPGGALRPAWWVAGATAALAGLAAALRLRDRRSGRGPRRRTAAAKP